MRSVVRSTAFLLGPATLVLGACNGQVIDVSADASAPPPPPPVDAAIGFFDVEKRPQDSSVIPPIDCGPGDVSSFTPPAYVPAAVHKGACALQTINDFDADCINQNTATSSKCSAFQKANVACVGCLTTPDTAAAWGPLIAHGTTALSTNIAGCIQLAGNQMCAIDYEAQIACSGAACDATCPIMPGDGGASYAALNACYQAADRGVCAQYAKPASLCSQDDGGPISTQCLSGTDFDATFLAIAPLFCGP